MQAETVERTSALEGSAVEDETGEQLAITADKGGD